jgi:NAD(P)-dependent dehydrogenase (short-subunit alcohol dehydrogenase family)
MLTMACTFGVSLLFLFFLLWCRGDRRNSDACAGLCRTASFYRVDVRDSEAVEEVINGVVRDFGSVDVLVCSAGVADNIAAEGTFSLSHSFPFPREGRADSGSQITPLTDSNEQVAWLLLDGLSLSLMSDRDE